MKLSVKDVADLLNVSEKTIYRMIKNETIPCFRFGGQWRFDRREITSWAEDTREFSYQTAVNKPKALEQEAIPLAEFIKRGGIYFDVAGVTKEEAIANCLIQIKNTIPQIDSQRLFEAIMIREQICSTAIGHGAALPHPRPFKEFTAPLSSIALCHLAHPISFAALDNEKVDTLFFVFPKSEGRFLRIQTKLLRLLKDESILQVLKNKNPQDFYEALSEKELEIFGDNL